MKKIHFYLCVFFFTLCLSAQRNPDKVLEFDHKVKDLIIVPFNGMVAISDGVNLHGYNPNDKKIVWTTPIPKASSLSTATTINSTFADGITPDAILSMSNSGKGSGFDAIPDTPFLLKFFDNRLYIINSFTGKFIFESTEKNIFFYQSDYLFDENALLLRGMENNALIIAKYDLKNKEYLWKTTVSEKFGNALSKISSLVGDDPTVGRDQMQSIADKVFVLAKSKFYALNKQSGKLLWKAEDVNYKSFYANQDASNVLLTESKGIFAGKELLYLKNATDGTSLWKDPVKTKRLVLVEDWQNRMLIAHYKGFNFYDYKTGEKTWKKDPKGKNIKSVIPQDTDFLYVYDDEMMLIDKEGQKKWKKDVKICDDEDDPIFFLEKTKSGKVLYVTATYANLVDYNTGKKLWKGNLKLNEKRPTFAKFDDNSGDFVVYNDEKMYRFNENSETKPKPYAKLKLKNEKSIASMDIFKNNVSISGQSEVVGINDAGEVVFHNKYSQPGELGRKFLKAGLAVGTFASAVATTKIEVYAVHRDANGNEVSQKIGEIGFDEKTRQIGEAGYFAGSIGKALVKKRFNALKQTDKYAIIFAKGENSEKLLVRVDKETGKELDKITVENNKPVYDYDSVSKDLFYSKGKTVKIFKGI